MPCDPIKGPDGRVSGYACSRGPQRKRCSYGGCKRSAPFLCDYPVKRGEVAGTCDRPCCGAHCKRVGPERDYCLAHAEHDAKRPELAKLTDYQREVLTARVYLFRNGAGLMTREDCRRRTLEMVGDHLSAEAGALFDELWPADGAAASCECLTASHCPVHCWVHTCDQGKDCEHAPGMR